MKRKLVIIFNLTLLLTLFNVSNTYIAHADSKERLEIKVEAGLNGKAKQWQGFPVTLTITNNNEDFIGDLVITLPRAYNSIGNKVIPIDIAAGTKKTISFSVPGMEGMDVLRQNTQDVQQFHLYEGNWETGSEVPIDSSLELMPTYIQEEKMVIGVLSDRPDSLNYLKLTTFLGNSAEVLVLDGDHLPEDSDGLDVIDLLVINDYAVAKLTDQVQATIKKWVLEGGTLVSGSEPGLQQQFGSLADMLPLTITGKETVQSIEGFQTVYQEALNVTNLELFTGDIDENATVSFENKGIPLMVKSKHGNGLVTQFTYDLGNPALSNWKGNDPLWQKISTDNGTVNLNNSDWITDVLTNTSRVFSTLANFKVSELLMLFLGYLLVIVPLLYFILRKLDKREWAWIIIPIIAVLSSVGLYTTGAKDRSGDVKTNVVSAITINQEGMGSGFGSTSMLSKESGSYTLTLDSELVPFPKGEQYGNPQSDSNIPFIESEGNKTNVKFRDVEFWSPRSVSIAYPIGEYGSFATDLALENEQITGEVTNNFDYDLKDIYLISGQNYHEIGELKAGESKKITIDAKNKNFLQRPFEQVAYQMFDQSGAMGQMNDQQLKTELLSSLISSQMGINDENPMLIGFANKPLFAVNVNGNETAQNDNHLFTQSVEIRLPKGENIALNTDINKPEISIIEGQIYHNALGDGEPFIDAGPGTYQFTYNIPEKFQERSFQLEELDFQVLERMPSSSYAIYNYKTDTYEEIAQNKVTYNQNADKNYVLDNAILIRIVSSEETMINVPILGIKGVTKQ